MRSMRCRARSSIRPPRRWSCNPLSSRRRDDMATEIRVPTLGESVTEATIGKWFKKPGDPVAADEPLVELETDKVTLEVNAPAAGVLGDILAKDGATVGPGAVLGSIVENAVGAKPAGQAAPRSEARRVGQECR